MASPRGRARARGFPQRSTTDEHALSDGSNGGGTSHDELLRAFDGSEPGPHLRPSPPSIGKPVPLAMSMTGGGRSGRARPGTGPDTGRGLERARGAALAEVRLRTTDPPSSGYVIAPLAVLEGDWWLFPLATVDHPHLLVPGAVPVYVNRDTGLALRYGELPSPRG